MQKFYRGDRPRQAVQAQNIDMNNYKKEKFTAKAKAANKEGENRRFVYLSL
jgi:hypothetical protein